MNITTIINRNYTTYEYYIKQHMQMVELNLNKIIHKNSTVDELTRENANHPLIRK